MSVRPVQVLPASVMRSHLRDTMRLVELESRHILLTRHGRQKAALIPVEDVKVLWQLQDRPVKEMEAQLKKSYARWLKAKRVHERGWERMELDMDR